MKRYRVFWCELKLLSYVNCKLHIQISHRCKNISEILVEDKKIARNHFEKFGSEFNVISYCDDINPLDIAEIKRFVFYPKKFECVVEYEDVSSAKALIDAQKSLQFPMHIKPLQQDQSQIVRKPNQFITAFNSEPPAPIAMRSSKKMTAVEMLMSHDNRSDVNSARQELENLMRKQAHSAEER